VLVKKPPLCEGSFLFATARPANEGGRGKYVEIARDPSRRFSP
jgi:hypothetical protein